MKIRRALGTLDPIIYFENQSGHIVLPPIEKGKGPALARMIYEKRFAKLGFMWKEAGTWAEVTKLQDRLVEQEQKHAAEVRDMQMARYDIAQARIAENMRLRMTGGQCSNYERDFCRYFLKMRGDKRDHYEKVWDQRNNYLWAVEMDSGTKVEDRMFGDNAL